MVLSLHMSYISYSVSCMNDFCYQECICTHVYTGKYNVLVKNKPCVFAEGFNTYLVVLYFRRMTQ